MENNYHHQGKVCEDFLLDKNKNDFLNMHKEKDSEIKSERMKKDFQITEKNYKDSYDLIKSKKENLIEKKKECLSKFNEFDKNLEFITEEIILKFCINNEEIMQNSLYENKNIKNVKKLINLLFFFKAENK